jgi:hypothetical protein
VSVREGYLPPVPGMLGVRRGLFVWRQACMPAQWSSSVLVNAVYRWPRANDVEWLGACAVRGG